MTQLLHSAQNNPVAFACALIVGVYFLKELLLRQLATKRAVFYIILFPGVILHELSHIIGCIIAFAPIKSFKLFSTSGGWVKHAESKIPFLGALLISLFPLAVGLLLIFAIVTQKDILLNFKQNYHSIGLLIVSVYFMLAIILTMLPSMEDLKNATVSLIIFLILIIALENKIAVHIVPVVYILGFCLIVLILFNILLFLINLHLFK